MVTTLQRSNSKFYVWYKIQGKLPHIISFIKCCLIFTRLTKKKSFSLFITGSIFTICIINI